jgi:predicted transposase/invertase (TIGR01784 family)
MPPTVQHPNQKRSAFADPINDMTFKKVFGRNLSIVESFINAVFKPKDVERIQAIKYLETESLADADGPEKLMYNVLCHDEKDRKYIIGVVNPQASNFEKRVQYYAAVECRKQLKKGDAYALLIPTVVVSVLNHRLFKDHEIPITTHRIIEEETGQHALRDLSWVFVELEKFHKEQGQLKTMADHWLYFLSHAGDAQEIHLNAPELVVEAYEIARKVKWTVKELDAYDMMEQELKDKAVQKEGQGRGVPKGLEVAMKRVAESLLAEERPLEEVCELTGFSGKEIEALMSQQQKEGGGKRARLRK